MRQIESSIRERKTYLREQEVIIAEVIEEGNIKLKSLTYQIRDLEERKEGVEYDLLILNQDKSLIMDELIKLQSLVDDSKPVIQ